MCTIAKKQSNSYMHVCTWVCVCVCVVTQTFIHTDAATARQLSHSALGAFNPTVLTMTWNFNTPKHTHIHAHTHTLLISFIPIRRHTGSHWVETFQRRDNSQLHLCYSESTSQSEAPLRSSGTNGSALVFPEQLLSLFQMRLWCGSARLIIPKICGCLGGKTELFINSAAVAVILRRAQTSFY